MQDIELPVVFFRVRKKVVGYCMALNITGAGKTLPLARKTLNKTIKITLEALAQNGMLKDSLLGLGWKKSGEKWSPLEEIAHEVIVIRVPSIV